MASFTFSPKIVLVFSWLIITGFCAFAQELVTPQRCFVTSFPRVHGLDDQVIENIIEDKNGFLWASSINTMQWFNGQQFRPLETGIKTSEIPGILFGDLSVSPENNIWLTHDKGLSVYNPDTHRFRHILSGRQIPSSIWRYVAMTPSEMVYTSGDSLHFINRSNFTETKKLYKPGIILSLPGASGKFLTLNNGKIYLDDVSEPGSELFLQNSPQNFTRTIAVDSTRIAFLYPDKTILYSIKNKTRTVIAIPASGELIAIFPSKDSKLILVYSAAVFQYNEKDNSFRELRNLNGTPIIRSGQIKTAFSDKYNNLWISTNIEGLFRLSLAPNTMTNYSVFNDERDFCVRVLADKLNNRILSGTYSEGLFVFDTTGKLIQHFGKDYFQTNSPIVSIGKKNKNTYLIGIYGEDYLWELDPNKGSARKVYVQHDARPFKGTRNGYYSQLISMPGNRLILLNGSDTLYEISETNNTMRLRPIDEKTGANLIALLPILMHSSAAPQFIFSRFLPGLNQQQVLQGFELNGITKWDEKIVVGTQKGIFIFDESGNIIRRIDHAHGLPNEHINAILKDKFNNLWFSHNEGISRLTPSFTLHNLSQNDGLMSEEFNTIAASQAEDGEMYFGGNAGITSFRPENALQTSNPPGIRLLYLGPTSTSLESDTAYWNINQYQFSHLDNRLTVRFSGMGERSSGDYNYQYRIKELSSDWQDLQHQQQFNLALPPGRYHIEILGGFEFNPQAKAGESYVVEISRPLYARYWFIGLVSLLLASLLGLLMYILNKRKLQKELEKLRKEKELEDERQRISRDLHDNMGAYTSALIANVETLQHRVGEDETLSQMKDNANQILGSLRETIWVLGAREMDISTLHQNFMNYSSKILRNYEDIVFDSEEDIAVNHLLKTPVAVDILKILQEGMQNIFLHSGAGKITARFKSHEEIEISLSDDGKGFNKFKKSNGIGLENMQWRAERAGVDLAIDSNPGQGTTLRIHIKKSSLMSIE